MRDLPNTPKDLQIIELQAIALPVPYVEEYIRQTGAFDDLDRAFDRRQALKWPFKRVGNSRKKVYAALEKM
jgi:hypothetical protein